MTVEARSYLSKLEKDKTAREKKAACMSKLLKDCPTFGSVLEIFGGAGVIRDLLETEGLFLDGVHETWDNSLDCVELLRLKYPESTVRHVDSFEMEIPSQYDGWDLISADFNLWTYLRYKKLSHYQILTDRIFRSPSKYIQLTDSAIAKFHLNRPHYETLLGPLTNINSYFSAIDLEFQKLFKVGLANYVYHFEGSTGAAYLLFERF